MGIKLLNSLIKKECVGCTQLKTLFQLKNKIIVIDTSIYLYRFKSTGYLIENIYLLCSILRYYDITPLFVFDGIPPKKKDKELQNRKKQKIKAKEEYDMLIEKNDKRTQKKLKKLRRIFTTVSRNDIENVKKLIKLYGLTYIIAEGEADELCARLVICGKAYACLSEDTDLFVYGCPRVLRYLSLRKHTVIMYTLNNILSRLNLTQPLFREMCVISGTDYNTGYQNIFYFYDMYKKQERIIMTPKETEIYKLFDIKQENLFDDLLIKNDDINKTNLISFMERYNFIFT